MPNLSDLFASRAGRAAYEIIEQLQNYGYQAYLVGGCVRNHLLDLPIVDYDITTSARPDEVKQIFKKTIDTGIRFGTVTVVHDGNHIEVTTFRSEGEYADTRHPDTVIFEESIEIDLSRRDFTMNAMAYSIDGRCVDPFGGKSDIEQRTIRCVGEPITRMQEDLLRCVRAFRFAAQLGFTIEPETMKAIHSCAPDLGRIARERIGVEWRKMLSSSQCMPLEQMIASGWMPVWDSSFSDTDDVAGWSVFQSVCSNLLDEESRMVCLAILLTKQESALKGWMQSLRYCRKVIQTCTALYRLVNQYIQFDLMNYRSGDQTYFYKLRQLLFEYGLNAMTQALSIYHCLSNGSYSVACEKELRKEKLSNEKLIELFNTMPIHTSSDLAIDGNDLIKAYGLAGGPWVKVILDKLTEQILCEVFCNEKQTLLLAGKKELNSLDSKNV